jgi:hypothetical protein
MLRVNSGLSEYYNLPENLRWRHVRYEPTSEQHINFTRCHIFGEILYDIYLSEILMSLAGFGISLISFSA